MLPTPKRVTVVAGAAEGNQKLTAFDRALLQAGIGNLNLIRVSSILPPQCRYADELDIPPGSLTPTAYGNIMSDIPGERIAAAVAVGFSRGDYGVIMEYAGPGTAREAHDRVVAMVEEALAARKLHLVDVRAASAESRVLTCAAAVAAAVMWY